MCIVCILLEVIIGAKALRVDAIAHILKRSSVPVLALLLSQSPLPSLAVVQDSITFTEYTQQLEAGTLNKVIFKGIRPTYLEAFSKDGHDYVVESGFPAFDDPLSPSGPAQAIALCTHTPGVTCLQDISDALSLIKGKGGGEPKLVPMLKHSSYPSEFAAKK